MLEDVQARADDRHLAIDEVGITGIRYPVAVADREHGEQDTVAEVSMSVDLPAGVEGTHLVRGVAEALGSDEWISWFTSRRPARKASTTIVRSRASSPRPRPRPGTGRRGRRRECHERVRQLGRV